MQELVARTMMLVAVFEPDSSVACQCREHRTVVRALANGERSDDVKAMTTHLSLVETRLRPRICEDLPAPLDEVLRDELARLGTRASAADGALQAG